MKRSVLKLVLSGYLHWYVNELPATGKPTVNDLRAWCTAIVDAQPEDGSGTLGPEYNVISEESVRMGLEWLFKKLAMSQSSDRWALIAVHALRLIALQNVHTILVDITNSGRTLGNSGEVPALG